MTLIYCLFFIAWIWVLRASAQETRSRQSLEGAITTFLTALTSHNSSLLPVAPDVEYTENTISLPFGSGLWQLANNTGPYRHDFVDVETGQVATITTLEENGIPVIYVARLKVESAGQISQIETYITRDTAGAERYKKLGSPEPVWLTPVPRGSRLNRGVLAYRANRYYDAIDLNDPDADYSFLDPDCSRLENALQTTKVSNATTYGPFKDTDFASLSCAAQFRTGFYGYITRIRDRRFIVVDEERQAVFSFAMLDHDGSVRTVPSNGVNGTAKRIPEYHDVPRSLHVAGAFQVGSKGTYRIETTKVEVPYGSRAPFDSDPISAAAGWRGRNDTLLASPCDRSCLNGAVEQVLKGMVDHKTGEGLPLARGAEYSENGRWIDIGDGLWRTLGSFSKPGGVEDYAVNFTDTTTGTGGYWGEVMEFSVPGILSLRVKVQGGLISEIEANIVRSEFRGPSVDTVSLGRPPIPVEYEGVPLGAIDPIFNKAWTTSGGRAPPNLTAEALGVAVGVYFDGLQLHSSLGVPFAAGSNCVRRDNGLQSNRHCQDQLNGSGGFHPANGLFNQTTTVRDRRILVADPVKGIVTAVAMVDNPATGSLPLPRERIVPGTYMVSHIFKFEGSSVIVRIETFIKWMPLGYKSAWSELELTK
ncbi:hypothetical protein B0T21DRAFT_432710 [Apiosordaria backusii]|uniref:DUF8021 domain-containing protein n=1 Tax=Apiosordaria backusii TaxID=314023 RepID=A0AA40ELN6_9PEZI|nr:hypothetical protein B0T21DRAFT_432710 [Apiosordaria backusii]